MKKIILFIVFFISIPTTYAEVFRDIEDLVITHQDDTVTIKTKNFTREFTDFNISLIDVSADNQFLFYFKPYQDDLGNRAEGHTLSVYDIEKDQHKLLFSGYNYYPDCYFNNYENCLIWSPDYQNFISTGGHGGSGFPEFVIISMANGIPERIINEKIGRLSENPYFINNQIINYEIHSFYLPYNENYEIWNYNILTDKADRISLIFENEIINDFFSDIFIEEAIFEKVMQAKKSGWLDGYIDGNAHLSRNINRAEFSKMLVLAFKESAGNTDLLKQFSDVALDQWYSGYMAKLVELEILKGYPDSTIHPEKNINGAEAMKMALEMLGYEYENSLSYIFPEEELMYRKSQWYDVYLKFAHQTLDKSCAVAACANLEFLNVRCPNIESDDNRCLESELTREEAIELITRVLEIKEEVTDEIF